MAEEDGAEIDTTAAAPLEEAPSLLDVGSETTAPDAKPTSSDPIAFEWPEDWRNHVAGEDEAAGNLLSRLKSPGDMAKKLVEQEKLIRSGGHKKTEPPAADASAEDVAAWREANGIPSEAAGYLENLGDLTIGDDDKEMIDSFAESMHGINADPAAVKAAIEWRYQQIENEAAQRAETDKTFREESRERLQESWGADTRGILTDLKAFVNQREGLSDLLGTARLGDGTLALDNPDFLGWLGDMMREVNPVSTVVPGYPGGAKGVDDRVAEINKMMNEDYPAYRRDTAVQEEYRTLLEAQEKQAARG